MTPEQFKILLRRQPTMLLIALAGEIHKSIEHLESSEIEEYYKILVAEFDCRGHFYEPDPDALPWERNFLQRYRLREYNYIDSPVDEIDRQIEINNQLIDEKIIGRN